MNRLGWVQAPEVFRHRLAEMYAFAESVRQDGIRDVVLCGMGGSSLAPEVLATVFGARVGFPRLIVLDSTDPEAIAAVEARIDLDKTLFVISSKSGTTIETDCLRRHFTARLAARGKRDAGRHLAAITDPGSQLGAIAESERWRGVFENPEDIGGRYAALSFFGLVPAALLGLDVERLVASAEREAAACRANGDEPCEALVLGAMMGRLAREGTDKMTLRCSPGIAPFGMWVEQLVAESTGKAGLGVLPVVDEAASTRHSRDRFYVDLLLSQDGVRGPLTPSDAPQATFHVRHPYEIGALFYRFEMATAIASAVIGVEPFDQPNVAEAKEATSAVLAGTAGPPETVLASGAPLSVSAPAEIAARLRVKLAGPATDPSAWLRALLALAAPGDYIGLLAYVARNASRTSILQEIRTAAGATTGGATTFGYGPCYLHSTGQFHKGGPDSGVFLLIEAPPPAADLPIPGKPFTFGQLFHAQAEGDYRALARRGRRVLRVRLAGPTDAALAALREALRR